MKKTAGTIMEGRFIFCIVVVLIMNMGCISAQRCNVVEKNDLSIKYDRHDEQRWAKPYYEFPGRHEQYRTVIPEDEFTNYVMTAYKKANKERAEPGPLPVTREQLKGFVLDGLNIRFMVEDICERRLAVTTIGKKDYPEYTEKVMLFDDEEVGTFAVMLLMPKKKQPVPAIIGLHGHGDNFNMFADKYMGRRFAKAGFAVIMPNLRAMNVNEVEFDVSIYLATNGFNLMGMHVYETLLLIKYLHYLDAVDNSRIGLISHSGGSSTANLVARVSDDISVQVTDMEHNYMGLAKRTTGIHCETIPAVHPFEQLINDLKTLPIPVKMVPYGFSEEGASKQEVRQQRDRVFDFFVQNLR